MITVVFVACINQFEIWRRKNLKNTVKNVYVKKCCIFTGYSVINRCNSMQSTSIFIKTKSEIEFLSDRNKRWITLNDEWFILESGHHRCCIRFQQRLIDNGSKSTARWQWYTRSWFGCWTIRRHCWWPLCKRLEKSFNIEKRA